MWVISEPLTGLYEKVIVRLKRFSIVVKVFLEYCRSFNNFYCPHAFVNLLYTIFSLRIAGYFQLS